MNAALSNPADASFATPSRMTSPGRHANRFDKLPDDIGELTRMIQNLVVYDVVAPDFYDYTVPRHRLGEIHIRSTEALLDRIFALDDRMLTASRPIEKRVVGRCHHFALLLVAILRSRHVPARMRCGFGGYFNPPMFEDHWVCEYWNESKHRWVLVDVQFDAVWRKKLRIDHDVLDVPRARFLVAASAWTQCRAKSLDPEKFGISFVDMHGLWYVAGNLVRDVAALNNVETLPWDVWGAQPKPGEKLDARRVHRFDRLAALAVDPEQSARELKRAYAADPGLAVPDKVFNALEQREEAFE